MAVCWGYRRTPGECRWLEGARLLVLSRLVEKMVNKLLKVSKMKTADFRNINSIICLAAPQPIDECRYLGNNWAGRCKADSVRAGAGEL